MPNSAIKIYSLEELINRMPPNSILTPINILEDLIGSGGTRSKMAEFLCACGNKKSIRIKNYLQAKTLSCGCIQKAAIRNHVQKYFPFNKKIYGIYNSMISRCYNKTSCAYKNYGARGVSVCDSWKDNYQTFLDWCLLNGWAKGLELDKDKIGDGLLYSPENCCFLTKEENNSFRRNLVKFEVNGQLFSCKELSLISGVPESTLYFRLKNGMLPVDAISLPKRKNQYK